MTFNGLIFIDANQYLDLYRVASGTKLLPALQEFADHIFVSEQVVDEVCRNKFKYAKSVVEPGILDLDKDRLRQLCHLLAGQTNQDEHFRKLLPDQLENQLIALQRAIERSAVDGLERVCKSQDEVSSGLSPLFRNAQRHTQEELERARDRHERGNPPGYKDNPLGDQLSWEQLLTRIKGKSQLWLVTNDGDYWVAYGKKTYLNPLLQRDLAAVGQIDVFPFRSILEWYNKFPGQAGVRFSKPLSPNETTELQKEYEALPPSPSIPLRPLLSGGLIPASGVGPIFYSGAIDPALLESGRAYIFRGPSVSPSPSPVSSHSPIPSPSPSPSPPPSLAPKPRLPEGE